MWPYKSGGRSESRVNARQVGGLNKLGDKPFGKRAKKAHGGPNTRIRQHKGEANDNDATTRKNLVQDLVSKVSSVHWQLTDKDINGLKDNGCVLTRRIALSLVQGWYDLLGLISPALIKGKLMMRELHGPYISWDTDLTRS